jgi:hypothetical protein
MTMDKILVSWLEADWEKAQALSDASNLLDLERRDPQHFVAHFHCRGMVRGRDGAVREADRFVVGYWFSENHLREVDPARVVTWLHPAEIFHPNVRPPFCCLGPIEPGTSLVDLLYRTYEVVSYQNVMPDEKDALNFVACQWARNNQHLFPVDDRPLKRWSGEPRARTRELPR